MQANSQAIITLTTDDLSNRQRMYELLTTHVLMMVPHPAHVKNVIYYRTKPDQARENES